MKKTHNKIIGPVIWAIIFGLIIAGYFAAVAFCLPFWLKVLILTAGGVVIAALGYVLFQRIKEIREENDDDFSQY